MSKLILNQYKKAPEIRNDKYFKVEFKNGAKIEFEILEEDDKLIIRGSDPLVIYPKVSNSIIISTKK